MSTATASAATPRATTQAKMDHTRETKEQRKERDEEEEEAMLQEWYIKRRKTLIVIFVNCCLYLFEMSAIAISAMYYFQYTLKVHNIKLFYSCALAGTFLLMPFSCLLVGRFTDRTRRVRAVALFVSSFNIIGNLMYVFAFYSWLPIVGRILCGIPDGIKSAYIGMF